MYSAKYVSRGVRTPQEVAGDWCYIAVPESVSLPGHISVKEGQKTPIPFNAHTIIYSYSLPKIEHTLDSLNGAVWHTALDLRAGYWQVEIDKASKPLMAFTVSLLGFYKCDSMPFRLVNAPATFQRLTETCLGDFQLNWCLIYLNDIIRFSKTPKDHLVQLRAVFQKLKEVGLKLKPSKCKLLR